MKHFLAAVFIFTICHSSCLAAITPEEASSQTYLDNHGHSPEIVRLIDLQGAQINGVQSAYKSSDPDWYKTNKPVNFIRKVFIYFDPGLDDDRFGAKNQIKFTDKWDEL